MERVTLSKKEWDQILNSVYETGWRDAIDKVKKAGYEINDQENRTLIFDHVFNEVKNNESK